MRPLQRQIVTALAGLALVAACDPVDTVVLVIVEGESAATIQQLDVAITVGGRSRQLTVPDAPEAILLPTSFTVQLSPEIRGGVSIMVRALGGDGATVATGTGTWGDLQISAANEVTVTLTPAAAGP